jgi:hypothetical protein
MDELLVETLARETIPIPCCGHDPQQLLFRQRLGGVPELP